MKRVVTSLLLIPSVTWVVFVGPPWVFTLVVIAFAVLCYHEYLGLVAAHGIDPMRPVGYAAGLLLLLIERHELAIVMLVSLVGLALALRASESVRGLPSAAAFLLGVIYVFGAWRAAIGLRALSPHWLFFTLALNWVGDISAFYVGRAIGRHKLAPRISPGKSWEGAVASTVAAVAFGTVYILRFLPAVPWWQVLALATAANVAGQVGDLAESALKRGAGVKDSSGLLPGHGGWLDRLDSTLFALPVVYWLLVLWR